MYCYFKSLSNEGEIPGMMGHVTFLYGSRHCWVAAGVFNSTTCEPSLCRSLIHPRDTFGISKKQIYVTNAACVYVYEEGS